MRSFLFSALFVCLAFVSSAQSDTSAPVKIIRPLQSRSKDHLMFQLGAALWQNKPDSINTGGGLSRTFNMYVMLDFPFKTSPKFSVALGPGLSTDHVFLDKMSANITSTGNSVAFRNLKDTVHFEKYKISTAFLELPIELRFSSRPADDGKSFKAAAGLKLGTMLAAWAKGKNLENASGNSVNDYLMKEKSKRFFNTTRLSAIGRLGYGHFSAFVSYAFTSVFKEGRGPDMNAMSVGLTLSGL